MERNLEDILFYKDDKTGGLLLREPEKRFATHCNDCGTDKASKHSYEYIYGNLFESIRLKNMNILEVGIESGASARMWKNYFSNSEIYAIDIDRYYHVAQNDLPASMRWVSCDLVTNGQGELFPVKDDLGNRVKAFDIMSLVELGVHVSLGDSTDQSFCSKYEDGFFDIIIDDGSHKINDQINTLVNFYPKLKTNGLYIIEDLESKGYLKYFDSLAEHMCVDLREIKNRWDDMCIVIRKNDSDDPNLIVNSFVESGAVVESSNVLASRWYTWPGDR
tara:strand:+ start:266 stop:1093 length:828 start_codon:yes stop_codon:yes gene_type:complete